MQHKRYLDTNAVCYDERMKFLEQIFFIVAVFILTTPMVVFAQFKSPLKEGLETVDGFVSALLKAVITVAFPIAVLVIVYSGFLFVTAQGNSEKLEKAKTNFIWTIIGVGVLLGAFALSKLLEGTIAPILN